MGDHTEALHKDMDRLFKEVDKLKADLKKNPNDAKAKAAKEKIVPFLKPESIKKRMDLAAKLDVDDYNKRAKTCGW